MLFPVDDTDIAPDWHDPYPDPVIESHDGILVVRDDLLGYGSKIRAADYLIGHDPTYAHVKEWVYGSCPAVGWAQISATYLANRYGKTAVYFMAKRDMAKLHPAQRQGLALGGDYRWVPNGMLSVTQRRAKDYVAEDPSTRALLPIGLDHPTVVASFCRVARQLPVKPAYVWSVGSSGTLSRGLQAAWPEAEVHMVTVGHTPSETQRGRAMVHRSPYAFDKPVKGDDVPPFDSAAEYDAKAWSVLRKWRDDHTIQEPILLWNVAGNL